MSKKINEILEKSNGGLEFYKLVIPDLKVTEDRCKNIHNPFYDDTKPGLSIYFNEDRWWFKDHGEPEYAGDVFTFAGLVYELDPKTQLNKILEYMDRDLKAEGLTEREPLVKKPPRPKRSKKNFLLLERDFTTEDLNYWNQFGIDKTTLINHDVVSINGYTVINSNATGYTIERGKRQLMFAYKGDEFAKIYTPEPKKFVYVGSKPPDFKFGWDHIDRPHVYKWYYDHLIITSGEKDVMTLKWKFLLNRAPCSYFD